MIDFKNGSYVKMKKVHGFPSADLIGPLMIPGEEFIGQYQAMRDFVIFTNKRVIAVNVQGVTGRKILLLYRIPKYSYFQLKHLEHSTWTANFNYALAVSEL